MPLQRQVMPNKVKVNVTALSVDSKIELFRFSIFPEKMEYAIDNIIKIGHNILNISLPFIYLYFSIKLNITFFYNILKF